MAISPRKALLLTKNIMGFRPNDIILASFPRAGSTWVRFILCSYLSLQEMSGQAVDLQILDDIMPTLSQSDLTERWSYAALPRFIKTHQPHRPLIFNTPRRVVYVLRDPRDVAVSYYRYLQNHTQRQAPSEFSAFLRHERYGLAACIRHFLSWAPHVNFTLRYEALKGDTGAAMSSLFTALNIPVDGEVLREAIERSDFRAMRAVLEQKGLSHAERFTPAFRVVNKGSTQEWVSYFSESDIALYAQLRERLEFEPYP